MRRRIGGILLLVAPFLAGVAGLGRGESSPGLYELTARSDLTVSVRVVSGSLKLALVEVQEVFRGAARPKQRLQVAFRDFNMTLGKEDRIVFEDGEADILFLVPEVNLEGRRKGDDRFTLYRGRFGRFTLPREGEDAYLEAIREFARLCSLKDHRRLFGELKDLLHSSNPLLVDAGLQEIGRLELMDQDLVPAALGFFQDPSPQRRAGALNLLARFFELSRDKVGRPDLQDEVLPPVQALARNDPEEAVRVAAVKALGAWGGAAVVPTLKEIAKQDPSQAVRYEADVILLRSAEKGKTPPPGGGRNP